MILDVSLAQLVAQYQFLLLIEIITIAGAVMSIMILLYGMGPWRKFLFYKGQAVLMTNPDNSYFLAKLRTLRKSLKLYMYHGQERLFRAGLRTGYTTTGGPRLYFGYSQAEMAANLRFIPWARKVLGIMKERWNITPQNWEQLCLVYYKDYIDRMLHPEKYQGDVLPAGPTAMSDGGQLVSTLDDTSRTILETDRELIQEIETGKQRPLIDKTTNNQYHDAQGRLLFYPPISVEEKEALVDRAENVMLSENPDIFNFDSVDLREVVLFRRSTFTDEDIDNAYREGFDKARETSRRDNTRLFLMGMIIFWILIGVAVLFTVLKNF